MGVEHNIAIIFSHGQKVARSSIISFVGIFNFPYIVHPTQKQIFTYATRHASSTYKIQQQ